MRRVRYSKTFLDQLDTLIEMGEDRFGERVANQKRELVLNRVEVHLADKPRTGNRDPRSTLYWYPIARTPFVAYYDFDEHELRVYYVMYASADRRHVDPRDVEWD